MTFFESFRLVEAFKYGYASRLLAGDPEYVRYKVAFERTKQLLFQLHSYSLFLFRMREWPTLRRLL